ncbi:MAG: nuclear transport factor 2 family protein [Flavipsychrobacter sp.]
MSAEETLQTITDMRSLVTISLLFIYSTVFAQDEKSLKAAAAAFHHALVEQDTAALKGMLSNKLVYGHSNGWKETKQEMMNNLYNGTIDYLKITSTDEQVTIDGNTGCIRATLEIDVIMEGKIMPFRLHGLQVWVWKNKKWQLLSRQSTKL